MTACTTDHQAQQLILNMKILIYSDLHLEFSGFDVPGDGFDVVVLAGDIHLGAEGARWAKDKFADVPVIYICGNHEFYRGNVGEIHYAINEETKGSNINFCENQTVQIDSIRFVCATLWTDFNLSGRATYAKYAARRTMNDYHLVRYGQRKLRPDDTEQFHHESRKFLESELKKSCLPEVRTVVVTHHAPSQKSLKYERVDRDTAPFYASAMDELILESGADLWIHGHTHESVDYMIGSTRVVSNPRGYSHVANEHGNVNFKPQCIIDI